MANTEFPDLANANAELLHELAPTITKLYEYHLSVAKTWEPSALAQDVLDARLSGELDPKREPLSRVAKSCATLGVVTESGLPLFDEAIMSIAPPDHPYTLWGRNWVAEESRHDKGIYAGLFASGAIDMGTIDRASFAMLKKGDTPHPASFAELTIYPTPQELATKINHLATARQMPLSYRALRLIFTKAAADENLHFNFYNGTSKAAFKVNPSVMTIAAANQLTGFWMPGSGMPGFNGHAAVLANAGVYGYPEQEDIFKDLIEGWGIESLTDLNSAAEYARDALANYMTNELGPKAAKMRQKRADRQGGAELNNVGGVPAGSEVSL